MTTKKEQMQLEREEAIKELRELMEKANYLVYTKLEHVSRSGMMRHISCFVMIDNAPQNINYLIKQLDSYTTTNDGYIEVGGCGMDMGFSVVYNLSSVLYQDNFLCRGEKCPANDHVNDRKPYQWDRKKSVGKLHSDGGYCLVQRWL